MKKIIFISLCLSLAIDAGELKLGLVPRGRSFRSTFADPREVKMALGFEGDSKINAVIGNYFSLFSLQQDGSERPTFHLGLEGAGYFGLVQANRRFPLESSDGLIGAYAEGVAESVQWQVRYTHISAHLADGSADVPIAYSREHLVLRMAVLPSELLRGALHLYGGVYYVMNAIPEVNPWALQLGVNYFSPWTAASLTPYFGGDLKWKAEADANPSADLQLGLALSNPREVHHSLRIFYAYHTGADPRGQFYQRITTTHALGIEMQI